MSLNILIAADGTVLNPKQNQLYQVSPVNGTSNFIPSDIQITLEFWDEIEQLPNGLYIPSGEPITAGLSGTLKVGVFASPNSPYPAELEVDTIDISSENVLQWIGNTYSLDLTPTAITGCNYINILLEVN